MMIRFLVAMFLVAGVAKAESYEERSIKKAADNVGVPAALLRAICYAESRLNRYAYAHQDGRTLGSAFGMCQVLYGTATSLGMVDEKCKESFLDRKDKVYKSCKLFGPYTSAYYAAKVLKRQLKRYDNNYINAVAAYNSGTVRSCPKRGRYTIHIFDKKANKLRKIRRKCVPGSLMNQDYVDRVMKFFVTETDLIYKHIK
jgi:soluble lytic murein transglycosylase-like protein